MAASSSENTLNKESVSNTEDHDVEYSAPYRLIILL